MMVFRTKKKILSVLSIHQCFYVNYFFLHYLGCMRYKIENDKVLYYYKRYKLRAYLYRLIYLTGLLGSFAYKVYDEKMYIAIMSQLSPVIKVVLAFECILSPIMYITVNLSFDWYRDKYVNFVNSLQSLDDKMQKQFPHIQWNYEKTKRKYSIMTVILYGFYTIASGIYIFNMSHCMCGWISSTIIVISYACVTGSPAFAGFLFIGSMDILRLRFRLLQKLLRQEIVSTHGKSHFRRIANVYNFKLLEDYFKEYTTLIIPLNQIFWMISASTLFHDFAVITSLGYLLCSKALDEKSKIHEYVFILLFMAPRIYKVMSTAIYGYATQKEQRNCSREFIEFGYLFKNSPWIKQHTEKFLHWRMHNKYCITVGKTVICNLSLIFLILNSVVNYIIVLIQLQFQQNDIVNKFRQMEFINRG